MAASPTVAAARQSWLGALALAILYTPGAAMVVALMMLNAFVTGSAALRTLRADTQPTGQPVSVIVLTGIALWIGVIAVSLPFAVHFQATYVLMLAAPLVAFPDITVDALKRVARFLGARDAQSGRERALSALIAALALIHALLAARPVVGFDASTMHLQFAEMLGHDHRWRFDVGRYAWAVMPLGADLQFAAAYLLDGERAARLLNLVFGGVLATVSYQLLSMHARRDVALAAVALVISAPIAFLETSSLYVENLWTAFLLASLFASLSWMRQGNAQGCVAALLCAAGVMQCIVGDRKLLAVARLQPSTCHCCAATRNSNWPTASSNTHASVSRI
ncbi:MAG: hypothetical protein ABIR52_02775, partial [Casimicrobiaceae bacterium]